MVSMRRRLFLWASILALGAALVVMSGALIRAYSGYSAASELKRAAGREGAEVDERLTTMGASVASLATERGIEAEIRERYPVVKPGEIEFVLLKGAEPQSEVKEEVGFWKGLYDILRK